jgi:hypothetical protein
VDKETKRRLKKLGKQEFERQSAELQSRMKELNPASAGSDAWVANYREAVLNEKWLRQKSPTLHERRLNRLFIVRYEDSIDWTPYPGLYVQCLDCKSAVPSCIPPRWLSWSGCRCGNIRWTSIFGRIRSRILRREVVVPVRLSGKGSRAF